MSYFKKYAVHNSKSNELLEEFDSMAVAEKFCMLMQQKGIQTIVKTDAKDAAEDTPDEYIIEGLDPVEPEVEFGSELDDTFSDDSTLYDWDKEKPDYEVEE